MNKGKKLSEETKEKMKGRTAHNKGIPMSEESKAKLSDSVKALWETGRYDSLKKSD